MLDQDREDIQTGQTRRLAILALCLLAALLAVFLAARLFGDIDTQVQKIEDVQTDNRTWNIAQLEVEMLRLLSAVQSARMEPQTPERLADLRLRFDIYYSRQSIIATAYLSDRFLRNARADLLVASQRAFVEDTVPLIDGLDADLIAGLEALQDNLVALHALTRPIVVEAFSDLIEETVIARETLRLTLRDFALAAIGLTVLMAVMVVLVLHQNRVSRFQLMASNRMQHALRQMIEASLDAVLLVDDAGTITACNHSAETMLAPRGGVLLGQKVWPHVTFAEDGPLTRPQDLRESIGAGRRDIVAQSDDGRSFPAEIVLAEAQSLRGNRTVIVFLRDMTDVVEREKRLTEARNAARHGEEAKARFLAVMSHEMRTPLNGILAAIELLRPDCDHDPRAKGFLDIVERCGQTALEQVNNVLELTRMNARDARVYPVSVFSPARHLADLVAQNQPTAAVHGNHLSLRCDPALADRWVSGRLLLFTRVINNFVGNALKFTAQGMVTVDLAPLDEAGAGQTGLRVTVSDTGRGIAPQDIARIFENFETLDASYARAREGSGLGLGIAKLAAEALGGRILVESEPGVGSHFTLEVCFDTAEPPRDALPPPEAPAPRPADAGPRRILVAEDNAINREVLGELLRADGHTVLFAQDGLQAVAVAAEADPDVILMDINMPDCDGIEATRRIRATGNRVPIVAVTAMVGPDQQAEFLGAGLNDVISKPINRARLRALLAQVLDGGAQIPSEPRDQDRKAQDRMPILDQDVWNDLVEALGLEAVQVMVRRFQAELGQTRSDLGRLIDAGDLAQAAQTAHRTAGSAAVLGFAPVAATLKEIQRHAQAGDEDALRTRQHRLSALAAELAATLPRLGIGPVH